MADDMRRRSDVRLEMPTSNRFPSRRKAANEENNQDQSNQEQDAPCIFAQQIPPSDKNHVTTDEMGLECHLSVRETASEADDQDQGSKQQKQPKMRHAQRHPSCCWRVSRKTGEEVKAKRKRSSTQKQMSDQHAPTEQINRRQLNRSRRKQQYASQEPKQQNPPQTLQKRSTST
jgi:hypothetical protein